MAAMTRLAQLSLRGRLLFGFGAVLAITLVVAAAGVHSVGVMNAQGDRLVTVRSVEAMLLQARLAQQAYRSGTRGARVEEVLGSLGVVVN
ncbi:hypothetical protein [Pseudomonas typographi]|uniref:hypothetical protein n=1 Tax=Pseudomonas typographi TaxID=2715964 RepID=UPI001688D6AF|nr:hypothetical protein [Pseudomonas typographi]MBD1589800.1 hypothetical protein [Pseudomonas typographi]